MAWAYKRNLKEELKERVEAGIYYWCRLQHSDGSFPEYSRRDHSFAAASFSTYAMIMAARLIGIKKDWHEALDKAGQWLSLNDERYLSNQEAMAGLALLELYLFLNKTEFLKAAENKIELVLNQFLKNGFFREKNGFDLGYSSLTLSILGNYHLKRGNEKLLRVAKDCCLLMDNFIYPDGSFDCTYNSRQTDWIILDGLEIFSPDIGEARIMLQRLLQGDAISIDKLGHIPDKRHLCTDLYRLCQAYDHAKADLGQESKNYKMGQQVLPREAFLKGNGKKREHLLNLLRPLGIHRFRGLAYMPIFARRHKAKNR